jgi:hypothetical protein
MITQSVSREEQLNALNALIECLDPAVLVLPESITKFIPPRPAGYDYTQELFKRRTGLAFDPLAAAETAADIPLSFLFNTSRLNRMVQYQVSDNGPGVDEMIKILMGKTWEAARLKGFQGLIQKQNEQMLLTYLLAVSVNDNASFATKAQMVKAIEDIKTLVTGRLNKQTDNTIKGYLLLTLERIKAPEKAKPALHESPPPGSPIGIFVDEY